MRRRLCRLLIELHRMNEGAYAIETDVVILPGVKNDAANVESRAALHEHAETIHREVSHIVNARKAIMAACDAARKVKAADNADLSELEFFRARESALNQEGLKFLAVTWSQVYWKFNAAEAFSRHEECIRDAAKVYAGVEKALRGVLRLAQVEQRHSQSDAPLNQRRKAGGRKQLSQKEFNKRERILRQWEKRKEQGHGLKAETVEFQKTVRKHRNYRSKNPKAYAEMVKNYPQKGA